MFYTLTYGNEPYAISHANRESGNTDKSVDWWGERYERYLKQGDITSYRLHFYTQDDNGILIYFTTRENSKLKKLPRVINKKQDAKHSNAVEKKDEVAQGVSTSFISFDDIVNHPINTSIHESTSYDSDAL